MLDGKESLSLFYLPEFLCLEFINVDAEVVRVEHEFNQLPGGCKPNSGQHYLLFLLFATFCYFLLLNKTLSTFCYFLQLNLLFGTFCYILHYFIQLFATFCYFIQLYLLLLRLGNFCYFSHFSLITHFHIWYSLQHKVVKKS